MIAVISESGKEKRPRCHCEGCEVKMTRKTAKEPWLNLRKTAVRLVLVILWLIFVFLAYRVSQLEVDHQEYDPYAILELDRVGYLFLTVSVDLSDRFVVQSKSVITTGIHAGGGYFPGTGPTPLPLPTYPVLVLQGESFISPDFKFQ